jgi:hypothetical protein
MPRPARFSAGCAALGLSVALAGPAALARQVDDPLSAAPRSLRPPAMLLPGAPKPYGGTAIDVLTYHYDNGRTGWNPTETDLTPASVASAKFGLLHDFTVDGNVFAQPLLVSGFVMPGHTTHDVLILATGHNSVYAFDAQTFALLWQVNLGGAQSSADIGCDHVVPEYGISSTPMIVRTAANLATLYVVAATEPASMAFHTKLHALSLADGHDLVAPAEIAPSAVLSNGATLSFDPKHQWIRAGLAYNDGNLYVAITSHCDQNASAISGWLLRYDRRLQLVRGFHTIETPHGKELASIWMSGFAPAIDASGNVYVVTGNGDYTDAGAQDYGESVLSLPPSLPEAVLNRFTPAAYPSLNFNDTDFSSGGVMLAPLQPGQAAPPMAVTIGKDDVLYLLDQSNLGGLRPSDSGALAALRLGPTKDGVWGGPAFYGGPAGPTVYVQTNAGVLQSFALATSAAPSLTPHAEGTTRAGHGGSLPIVSSHGAAPGSGVVWLMRRSIPTELEAYDAVKLGAPIFSANVGSWSNTVHNNPFLTPMEANGRVYVTGYLSVKVFGLTQ